MNGETWNDCEEKVQDMSAQKLGLDGIETERAHQMSNTETVILIDLEQLS